MRNRFALSSLLLAACAAASPDPDAATNSAPDSAPGDVTDAGPTGADAAAPPDVPDAADTVDPTDAATEDAADVPPGGGEDEAGGDDADVPAPSDAQADAADGGDAPAPPTHPWAAGQVIDVQVVPGTVTATGPLAADSVEAALGPVMQIHLVDDGGTLRAWVQARPWEGARPAEGDVLPGAPLALASTGWDESSTCTGTWLEAPSLALDGVDGDGDGALDAVHGTLTGTLWEVDGDYTTNQTPFSAAVEGAPDATPPALTTQPAGTWPALRIVMRASEPLPTAALAAATSHAVGGAPAPFTLEPQGLDGPPGAATQWLVAPAAPYAPGVHVSVTVAPLSDVAGNAGTGAPEAVADIPPLPEPTITAAWDLSEGNPFAGTGGAELTPAFGPVPAPSGGAMAALTVYGPNAQTWQWTAGVALPSPAHEVRVTMAVAMRGDVATYPPDLVAALATNGGGASALIPTEGGTDVQVAGDTWSVTPFTTVTLDATGLGGLEGLLRLYAFDWQSDGCLPGPNPDGEVRLLVDAVAVD